MLMRRDVVTGGLAVIAPIGFCACRASGRQTPNTVGCTLADADIANVYPRGTEARLYITGTEEIVYSSGNRDLDKALAQTLAKCADLFDVLPGFAFYNDNAGLNAYATSRVRMSRADGTVLFGQGLLRRLMNAPEAPDACIAAVCAHEFGHILQYKRGLYDKLKGYPTAKRIELQADFFAGYFAGTRKRERQSYPAAVFAMTQYTFGDNMVNNPDHHGTPQERGATVVAGYQSAFIEKLDLNSAIERSMRYISNL